MGEKMGQGISKEFVLVILEKMRECVQKYRFYFEPERPENAAFITDFSLDEDDQVKILVGLQIEDYCESEESRRFPGNYIHIFAPKLTLKNQNQEIEELTMYIKFEIREMRNGEMVAVISFHRLNYKIYYAFP